MTSQPLVAVDALALGARGKGAARVILNLLAALPAADPSLAYVALVTEAGAGLVRERAPGVEVRVVGPSGGVRWELAGVAHAAEGADLVFTVRELVPRHGPPVLMHVFEPPAYRLRAAARPSAAEAKRFAKDALLAAAFPRTVARAAAVTAGSRATADWIAERTGRQADVVLPGIDQVFFEAGGNPPPDEPPYVLHPSSGDARENTELVLRAFTDPRLAGLRLVLVGTPERLYEPLRRRARSLGVTVELAGWVTDERLRELYRGATAVVTPSRYEGYAGYPALEAMALGAPVVALEAPGVTEALAGRALLVRGEDASTLAAALARTRDDPALRAELTEAASAHVRTLTWERSAHAFAAAFRKALAGRA